MPKRRWCDNKDEGCNGLAKDVDDFVKCVNEHIGKANESFQTIKSWRDKVVAHRDEQLRNHTKGDEIDGAEFERLYAINVSIATKELDCIEKLLEKARELLGTKPTSLTDLKEDAFKDARMAIEYWLKGVESATKDFLASLQPSVNPV